MKKRTAAQKIHFIGALVYVGACLLLGIYRIVDTGSVFNLFKCWVSVLYLLIPPILCWLFRKKPSYSMNLCIYGFMFVAYTLGVAMEWYHYFSLYDLVAHFLSGVFFAIVGLCAYFFLRKDSYSALGNDPLLAASFTFLFSGFVAGFWEILEYLSFLITGYDSQNVVATGVADSMEDMIAGILGGLVIALYWYFRAKKRPDHPSLPPVQEFYDANYSKQP